MECAIAVRVGDTISLLDNRIMGVGSGWQIGIVTGQQEMHDWTLWNLSVAELKLTISSLKLHEKVHFESIIVTVLTLIPNLKPN